MSMLNGNKYRSADEQFSNFSFRFVERIVPYVYLVVSRGFTPSDFQKIIQWAVKPLPSGGI